MTGSTILLDRCSVELLFFNFEFKYNNKTYLLRINKGIYEVFIIESMDNLSIKQNVQICFR